VVGRVLVGVPRAGGVRLAVGQQRFQQAQLLQSLFGEGDALLEGGI
jgi:hypothetical protein